MNVYDEFASQLNDIARRCGVARDIASVRVEIESLANRYQRHAAPAVEASVDPGEGWRISPIDEKPEHGDQYTSDGGKTWKYSIVTTNHFQGLMSGREKSFIYRRRISVPVEPAAPAVKAGVDERIESWLVFTSDRLVESGDEVRSRSGGVWCEAGRFTFGTRASFFDTFEFRRRIFAPVQEPAAQAPSVSAQRFDSTGRDVTGLYGLHDPSDRVTMSGARYDEFTASAPVVDLWQHEREELRKAIGVLQTRLSAAESEVKFQHNANLTILESHHAVCKDKLALSKERDKLRSRLDEIDAGAKADEADLAKMRDGVKLNRWGLVQIIVYQQQDIKELKAERDKLAARVEELEKQSLQECNSLYNIGYGTMLTGLIHRNDALNCLNRMDRDKKTIQELTEQRGGLQTELAVAKAELAAEKTRADGYKHETNMLGNSLRDISDANIRLDKELAKETAEANQACAERDAWRDKCDKLRKELAAMTEQRDKKQEQAKYAEECLEHYQKERIAIARTYDPNCDEYDYQEQIDRMKGARECVEALQDLTEAIGRDPEGCLVDSVDEVLGKMDDLENKITELTNELAAIKQGQKQEEPKWRPANENDSGPCQVHDAFNDPWQDAELIGQLDNGHFVTKSLDDTNFLPEWTYCRVRDDEKGVNQ